MGKVIKEIGYGPGSYLLLMKADAAPEQTLVQYDCYWRPEDVPSDIADLSFPRDLPRAGSPPPGHHCPPDGPCPVFHDDRRY